MARYAWGMPGERTLEPGDAVFYMIPVIEAVPRGKGKAVTLQPVFEDGYPGGNEVSHPVAERWMAGVVRIVDRSKGALFTVYDHILRRDVAVPESYMEYVPPFNDQQGIDTLTAEINKNRKRTINHKRKIKL